MKAAKPDKTTADLPMKDGAVDRAGWDAKPEVERRAIWEALSAIHDELRFLNAAPLVSGKRYFVLFFILLLPGRLSVCVFSSGSSSDADTAGSIVAADC
jgi:hypothetical protein